jgi:hypothetical protein
MSGSNQKLSARQSGANKRRLFRTAATSIVAKMNVEIIFHNGYSMNSRTKIRQKFFFSSKMTLVTIR